MSTKQEKGFVRLLLTHFVMGSIGRRSGYFVGLLVFLALSTPSCLASLPPVVGVNPQFRAQYEQAAHPQGFSCLDGSLTVSWDRVNDEYCDCPDSSDEPGA
eukprot:5899358-Pyramimonas_sp.AAC.2